MHTARVSRHDKGKTTTRICRAISIALLALVPTATVAGQVSERDKLLNCFYDARTSRPDEARSCLARLLDAQPGDTQALLELGYFELAQKNDTAAIQAFTRALATGSTRADVRT